MKTMIMKAICFVSLIPASASVAHGSELTVALLQMKPNADNLDANAAKAEDFCRRAAKLDADLALMPEMWSIGYTRPDPKQPCDVRVAGTSSRHS